MSDHRGTWIAAGLLAAHAGLLAGTLWLSSTTVDEPGHLAAGLSYWKRGAFSVYHHNPPLAKLVAAAPVLAANPGVEEGDLINPVPGASRGGFGFLGLLRLGRLPGVAWSVLAGVLIYRWSRELFGTAAGLLSLALWCVEPTVLGHAPLVTGDVPAAATGLLASYAFCAHLRRPTAASAAVAGVALGAAQSTKFTLLVLYPVWAVAWAVALVRRRRDVRPWPECGRFLLLLVISLYVLNLGYAFQGSGTPLGGYRFASRMLAGGPEGGRSDPRPGSRFFRGRWPDRVPLPLPREYLLGIDAQRRDFESHLRSYLAGEWRYGGWWYYYLYALAVKLPIGTIAVVAWSLALTAAGPPRARRPGDAAVLLATGAAMLGLISSQSGFSQHMRYVLPCFPYFFILAGRVVAGPAGRAAWVAWGLVAWSAASSLAVYPHSISYFNEAAGGPLGGHAYLLDSNIDWGQDLLSLKRWVDAHPEARPLGLVCLTMTDPRVMGLRFSLPPPGPDGLRGSEAPPPEEMGPKPGYYAVSVNYLRGMAFPAHDGAGGQTRVAPFDYAYFLRFRPVARAGYSLYIYRITPEQAAAVRRSMGLPPLPETAAAPGP